MAQIPPIEDAYIDEIIKAVGAYNPALNKTQGVKLRELVKRLRDRFEQEDADMAEQLALKAMDTDVVHKTGDEDIAGEKTFSSKTNFTEGWNVPDGGSGIMNGSIYYPSGTGGVDLGVAAGGNSDSHIELPVNVSGTLALTDDLMPYQLLSEKNTNNGYAGLDAGGKVPFSLLPATLMVYKGVWDAVTNTPALADGAGTAGYTYRVTGAPTPVTHNFGSGNIEVTNGDYLIYNDSGIWEKSDGSDAVTSVNGQQGVVVLDKTDIGLGNVDNTSDLDKPVSTPQKNYIDGLAKKEIKVIAGTTYTILQTDFNKILQFTANTVVTVTVPAGIEANSRFEGKQLGSGQVSFVGATGVTINVASTEVAITAEINSVFGLDYVGVNEFDLYGRLVSIGSGDIGTLTLTTTGTGAATLSDDVLNIPTPDLQQLQDNIDNIQVGGKNLLRNSDFSTTGVYWINYGQSNSAIVGGKLRVTWAVAGSAWGISFSSVTSNPLLIAEQEYTMSALITTTKAITIVAYIGGHTISKVINGTDIIVFTNTINTSNKQFLLYATGLVSGDFYDIDNVKIEKGNKATDWTSAPEDVQAGIDAAQTAANTANSGLLTKANLASPTFTGTVSGITKAMVGLGNVDNTTDLSKPISSATQTALNLKAPLASPVFTGTVGGITKAMVGLGSVENTSDAAKPVSTAAQTALNLKANLANPTFTGTPSSAAAPTVGAHLANKTYVDARIVLKADVASPTFTGTPLAPTPLATDNSTKIATTAFVKSAVVTSGKEDVSNKSNDINLGSSSTLYPTQNAVWSFVLNLTGRFYPSTQTFSTSGTVGTYLFINLTCLCANNVDITLPDATAPSTQQGMIITIRGINKADSFNMLAAPGTGSQLETDTFGTFSGGYTEPGGSNKVYVFQSDGTKWIRLR